MATVEKSIIRISFSNLFKEFKSTTTWIQFPFVIQAPKGTVYEKAELNAKDLSGSAPPITKWTILCVDIISLIQQYVPNRTYHSVRGYKLCANLLIKNVITSDVLYQPGMTHAEAKLKNCGVTAFPRELSFPCEKYENWYQLYDYVVFPSDNNKLLGQSHVVSHATSLIDEQSKRTSLNKQVNSFQNVVSHLLEKHKQFRNKPCLNLPLVCVPIQQENENDIHVFPFKSGHDEFLPPPMSPPENVCNQDVFKDVDNMQLKFQSSLEPDPILRLRKIIGFGGNNSKQTNMQSVIWSQDSQYLIYSSQAIVVAYHVNTNAQWCFVGHADKVSCLALSTDNKLIASGQSGPFSLVRIWDFDSRKCLAIFRNHDHSLYLLEFSHCGNYLCGVGKDKQGKTMMILWDIKEIGSKQNGSTSSNSVRLVAKAHTDVHINKILFVTYDSSRLISCGKDNVRFWRLKDDTLRSCAVSLSPYIQALNTETNQQVKICLEFTDICMNTRLNASNENLVYACTKTGQIFEFNTNKMEIENVRVLEPLLAKKGILTNKQQEVPLALRLNSLTVTSSFCATGSDDGFVRVWSLDFSQVSVEAEHEAPISIVRFSPNCSQIATATLNGNLGVLDVKQKEYITLVRSHSDSIIDAAIDSTCRFIATSSLDNTVRVWNFETCRQLYDFQAVDESPTRVSFCPVFTSNTFSCGFSSGKVRVFSVEQAKMITEIQSPHAISSNRVNEITDLKYSNDGQRLITGDLLKYLCLYDVERDYSLVRMLPNCISASGSLCLSPDDKHLAVIGSTDYLLTVFETYNLNEVLRIDITSTSKPVESAIKLTYASHDSNQLICVTSNNKLVKFDSKTGRIISSVSKIHKTSTNCLIASSDGRYLITSGDNSIKVWDYEMRLEKNFQTFIGHSSSVNCLLLTSPDNSTLISIGDSIVFWDFLAFKAIDSIDSQKTMPKGRELSIVKEIKTHHKFKKQSLTSKSMSSIQKNISTSDKLLTSSTSLMDWITSDGYVSFEKPRTPPIATEIQTVINSDIEDTFLNDEITLLESNFSTNSSLKKFTTLPNFVNGDAITDQYLSEQYDTEDDVKSNLAKQPTVLKHLNTRKKVSVAAHRRYMAPADKCGLKLNSVIGFNGKHATQNMVWSPEREFFAYSIGSIVCTEDLTTGKQRTLYDHQEDVTVLTLRHDNTQMASASAYLLQNKSIPINNSTAKSVQSQITIWNCDTFEIFINLFHKNSSNITCMNYSSDDRFLISIGDYKTPSLIIWNTYDYSCLVSMDNLNHVIHDVAWNPCKCNEFVMCGQNKMLIVWSLDEKPKRTGSLRSFECEIPLAICDKKNDFHFTSIAYNSEYLLFAATNFGLITVWQTKTNSCFLNWQADTNEIDFLVCIKHNLITGSTKGCLKLWNIASIHEMKQNKLNNIRTEGLTIENEIQVNGSVKCGRFDSSCEIGIVATNKNALFYLNWAEDTQVRLVSTHTGKINSICCINDKYISTASDDGSLNVWSIVDRERIVQFEVKAVAATCQTLLFFENNENLQRLVKYVKTANNKTPFIIVGYSDGSVRIFDIDRKCIVSKLKVLEDEISSINYCLNSKLKLVSNIELHQLNNYVLIKLQLYWPVAVKD